MEREQIEDIILRHSQRGMNVLRQNMEKDFCKRAAEGILSWDKGTILLTTGFYVAGFAETDGPAGCFVLSEALKKIGYHPVVVTDQYCQDFFEWKNIEVEYVSLDADEECFQELLKRFQPVGLISIERCGINTEGDYANMRGISIREHTAAIDLMFSLSKEQHIPTIGVGDGGNEIGMGNCSDIISKRLSLVPCTVSVDRLVIASVSNWGAYGIAAYLALLTGKCTEGQSKEVEAFIARTVEIGSVDGVTHERVPRVDGYPDGTESEILDALHDYIERNNRTIENV